MSHPQSHKLEPRQANSTQPAIPSPTNLPLTSLTPPQPPQTTDTNSASASASASAAPTPSSSSSPLPSSSDSSPTASATSDPNPTATSFTPSPASTSSPAPSSTEGNPQPSSTSTSASVQPTSSSSSLPDEQTSSSASSPAPSPTPIQTSTSEPPPQPSSNPPSSASDSSSASAAPPPSNTFSSRPPSSSQVSSQIVIVTSTVYRTSTDPTGTVHTLTSYVDVPSNRPVTTISTPGGQPVAQLHDGDTHPPGFFDNRGAVIGTFLTVGLIVLGGSAAIIWRLARLRRARLRAREDKDAELNFGKFLGNDDDGRVAMLPLETENDDFQTIPLNQEPQHPQSNGPQFGPHLSSKPAYLDDPAYLNMQEIHPVRFSNRTNLTGRSSDLDTMNTEEWGRYINTNFSNGAGRAFGDGNKPELVRVEEEAAVPAAPPIIISGGEAGPAAPTHLSSFRPPPADPQPDIQTVEQETFTMVSPPRSALEDQSPRVDERLEPTILPGYNLQRPRSENQNEISSLRDEEDYSRRILRVSNPDHEENEDQHSSTQTQS